MKTLILIIPVFLQVSNTKYNSKLEVLEDISLKEGYNLANVNLKNYASWMSLEQYVALNNQGGLDKGYRAYVVEVDNDEVEAPTKEVPPPTVIALAASDASTQTYIADLIMRNVENIILEGKEYGLPAPQGHGTGMQRSTYAWIKAGEVLDRHKVVRKQQQQN